MLGAGFRRGGSAFLNAGKTAMSHRVVNQHRRSLAISVCLAHKVSLANAAPNALGATGKYKILCFY